MNAEFAKRSQLGRRIEGTGSIVPPIGHGWNSGVSHGAASNRGQCLRGARRPLDSQGLPVGNGWPFEKIESIAVLENQWRCVAFHVKGKLRVGLVYWMMRWE